MSDIDEICPCPPGRTFKPANPNVTIGSDVHVSNEVTDQAIEAGPVGKMSAIPNGDSISPGGDPDPAQPIFGKRIGNLAHQTIGARKMREMPAVPARDAAGCGNPDLAISVFKESIDDIID